MKPKARDFDGIQLQTADGVRFEVYEPRWWQLGRWLHWWKFSRYHGKAGINFHGKVIRCRVVPSTEPAPPERRLRTEEPHR